MSSRAFLVSVLLLIMESPERSPQSFWKIILETVADFLGEADRTFIEPKNIDAVFFRRADADFFACEIANCLLSTEIEEGESGGDFAIAVVIAEFGMFRGVVKTDSWPQVVQ